MLPLPSTLTKGWAAELERKRKPKRLMQRRTSPNAAPYVYSLSYNKVTAYKAGESLPLVSGSSFNRKPKKRKLNASPASILATIEAESCKTNVVETSAAAASNRKQQPPFIAVRATPISQGQIEPNRTHDAAPKPERIHVLSSRSKSKIREKFCAFYRAATRGKGKCTLVTLSFINKVSDKTGVSILNKFLTALREDFNGLSYIWVAERQENGNIHFHMMVNRRIKVSRGNPLWVLQQYNAGIMHEKYSFNEIVTRYKNGTMGGALNPFDVKQVNGINGLALYLTSYLTKENELKGFGCQVWHCSRSVSRLFTKAIVNRSTFALTGSWRNTYVNRNTGELTEPKEYCMQHSFVRYIVNKGAFVNEMWPAEVFNVDILTGKLKAVQVPTIDLEFYQQFYLN